MEWEKSNDYDFESYHLEKSLESNMINSNVIFSSTNIDDTTFIDENVIPIIYFYYRYCIDRSVRNIYHN